jgi:hypothetical protein
VPARSDGESLSDQFGKLAFAAHARAEARIIIATAAHLPHQTEHMFGTLG